MQAKRGFERGTSHASVKSRRALAARCEQQGRTAMSHRFTIEALKELIAARSDGEQGLRICAEHARNPQLRAILLAHLHDSTRAVQELQSLVRVLGGDPGAGLPTAGVSGSSAANSAAAHRRW